jgi:Cu/Ag efflux protein CusF
MKGDLTMKRFSLVRAALVLAAAALLPTAARAAQPPSAPASPPPVITVSATIKKVDVKTRKVTAEVTTEDGKESHTAVVAKTAKIRKKGKSVTLSAIKPGDKVQAQVKAAESGYTVIAITVQ